LVAPARISRPAARKETGASTSGVTTWGRYPRGARRVNAPGRSGFVEVVLTVV
jgi:hypothetical protein